MRRRSGFGWLDLLLGIGLICLGILALVQPDWALTTLVVAYGIAAVVMGVTDILLFIRVERYTGLGPILSLISGVLSVMTGLMLVVYPHAGVLMLTVLFPIWFIAHVISPADAPASNSCGGRKRNLLSFLNHPYHRSDFGYCDDI